ncbi:hypothetical protein DJ568_12720 [Mucilaginibacter hurinus]|uniref:Methylamine utilisation protein MauE domain-containing protein n=1 Tax=Mucilaginibacter hurinus TaxID=2201324 RepID=A0A367GPB0_9SPHI|nr:MauE/DoxX family redox-associated membrane protein [Mucilaginibacter hurinus]RCH54676.1 hypothetical protein DJ568_12720 [Mucilaginibacter hurinus]
MNALTSPLSFRLSQRKQHFLIELIRYACVFLFVYTAYAKISEHQRFLNGLTKVQLIRGYAEMLSVLVPGIEIIIAVLLIIPKTVKVGLMAFTGVMGAFTVYIISAMIWESHLPCSCGGAIEKLTWMQHIWFNLAFILLAIIALRLAKFSNYLKN